MIQTRKDEFSAEWTVIAPTQDSESGHGMPIDLVSHASYDMRGENFYDNIAPNNLSMKFIGKPWNRVVVA